MRKRTTQLKEIISIIDSLCREYPSHNLGRHLSLALSDYPDLFSVSDGEILFAFQKYQTELSLDYQQAAPEEYVRKIEEDASHLFDRQTDEWEEDEY